MFFALAVHMDNNYTHDTQNGYLHLTLNTISYDHKILSIYNKYNVRG